MALNTTHLPYFIKAVLEHHMDELSNADLVAALLFSGELPKETLLLANELVRQTETLANLQQVLIHSSFQGYLTELQRARLLAACELAHRLEQNVANEQPYIRNASDVAYLMRDMGQLRQEHVRVLLLDNHERILGVSTIYVGTVNQSVIRAAEIYREALLRNCPALIMVHNHPSGDPTPSVDDIELTRMLVQAGKLLDIQLLDHIVMGNPEWKSMRLEGII